MTRRVLEILLREKRSGSFGYQCAAESEETKKTANCVQQEDRAAIDKFAAENRNARGIVQNTKSNSKNFCYGPLNHEIAILTDVQNKLKVWYNVHVHCSIYDCLCPPLHCVCLGRKGDLSDKLEGGCAKCCAKYCRMTPMTQALCCSELHTHTYTHTHTQYLHWTHTVHYTHTHVDTHTCTHTHTQTHTCTLYMYSHTNKYTLGDHQAHAQHSIHLHVHCTSTMYCSCTTCALYMYMYMHALQHTLIHTYLQCTCTHVQCTCTNLHTHARARTHTHTHTHAHTHTHTHTHLPLPPSLQLWWYWVSQGQWYGWGAL